MENKQSNHCNNTPKNRIESKDKGRRVKTFIDVTRPLNFHFRKAYKTQKEYNNENFKDIAQTQQHN